MSKPSWDQYFINMLESVSERASCDRGRSSAIIVRDNRILATGYVGAVTGMSSCDDVGHDMISITNSKGLTTKHCRRSIHSELNAILSAARFGVTLLGSTIYCTMVPCRNCADAIVQVGIKRVVANFDYQASEYTKELFILSGIKLEIINNDLKYIA